MLTCCMSYVKSCPGYGVHFKIKFCLSNVLSVISFYKKLQIDFTG